MLKFRGLALISPVPYKKTHIQYSGVRQKASIMQSGESPLPIKPSQQSVLSLGVETARSDLSVGKGVCEPKCECVKPNSPVKLI